MTPEEKSYLTAFVTSPAWPVVKRLAEDLKMNVQSERSIRDTEWETITTAIGKDKKQEGINYLLEEIYKNTL